MRERRERAVNANDDLDMQVWVSLPAGSGGKLRVLHPCRCDAPDPEAARMEPLDVPVERLRADGRCTVVCPECETRVVVHLA